MALSRIERKSVSVQVGWNYEFFLTSSTYHHSCQANKIINSTTAYQWVTSTYDNTLFLCTIDFSTNLMSAIGRTDFFGQSVTFISTRYIGMNPYMSIQLQTLTTFSVSFPSLVGALYPLTEGEQFCITAVPGVYVTNQPIPSVASYSTLLPYSVRTSQFQYQTITLYDMDMTQNVNNAWCAQRQVWFNTEPTLYEFYTVGSGLQVSTIAAITLNQTCADAVYTQY